MKIPDRLLILNFSTELQIDPAITDAEVPEFIANTLVELFQNRNLKVDVNSITRDGNGNITTLKLGINLTKE